MMFSFGIEGWATRGCHLAPHPMLMVTGRLPVFAQQFEIGLGVCAGRAYLGRFQGVGAIAAVQTVPFGGLLPLEDPVGLDIAGQLDIPLFVLGFGDGNAV